MNDANPYFDMESPFEAWRSSRLPHREQNCKIQFVTIRLADSLPQSILSNYKLQKEEFIRTHPYPWDNATQNLFSSQFTSRLDKYLDAGYGECLLRFPETRKKLISSLYHFHKTKYHLLACVIMPNHTHILVMPYEGYDLEPMMKSIKRFSATEINRLHGRRGRLWEEEYFDTLIRSHTHFQNRLNYIRDNPRNLPPDSYSFCGTEFDHQS